MLPWGWEGTVQGGCEQGRTVDAGPGWVMPEVQAVVQEEGEREPSPPPERTGRKQGACG